MSPTTSNLTDLPWLPRLSADFRNRVRSIELEIETDWGPNLRALATQYLGLNEATLIARALNKLRAQRLSPSLSPFRLGLVSNATTDFLKPFLEASALPPPEQTRRCRARALELETPTRHLGSVLPLL